MQAAAALLPCATILVAVIVLGWSGMTAALLALVVALGLWATSVFLPATLSALGHAVVDAALLTAIVASVIIPGLVFVTVTERRQSQAAIVALVERLGLSTQHAALLIAVGIGVAVESLTGMGVSLLITVPLLARTLDTRSCIVVALAGMSLMPWGAVALGTMIGAKIAAIPLPQFSAAVWAQSAPIAFVIPLLVVASLTATSARDYITAATTGVILVVALGVFTHLVGVEVAGALGGTTVIVYLAAARMRELRTVLTDSRLLPYALLLAAVILQKLAVRGLDAVGMAPNVSTGRIVWNPLTTPGIALVLAALLCGGARLPRTALTSIGWRGAKVMTTIGLFLVTARLLYETGGIRALVEAMSGLGPSLALTATGVLAAIGGLITGSGVTGNALFMPSASEVGQVFDARLLFSALQNAGASHGAVASLPLATLVAAAMPGGSPGIERAAMRTGLVLACAYLTLMIVWAHLRWSFA